MTIIFTGKLERGRAAPGRKAKTLIFLNTKVCADIIRKIFRKEHFEVRSLLVGSWIGIHREINKLTGIQTVWQTNMTELT